MWSHIDWHEDAEWKEFYPDATKPIPPNAPEPQVKDVQINIYCDATHATCLATHRLTTGIIVCVNGAAMKWYSKQQNTVESSTFGSDFEDCNGNELCTLLQIMDDGCVYQRPILCPRGQPRHHPECDKPSVAAVQTSQCNCLSQVQRGSGSRSSPPSI